MTSSPSHHHEPNNHHKEGDYIINWHQSYITSLASQSGSFLENLLGQIRSEIAKIQSDNNFIETKMHGPHHNLQILKKAERDLRILLDPIQELSDRLEKTAKRASNRLL